MRNERRQFFISSKNTTTTDLFTKALTLSSGVRNAIRQLKTWKWNMRRRKRNFITSDIKSRVKGQRSKVKILKKWKPQDRKQFSPTLQLRFTAITQNSKSLSDKRSSI